MGYRKKERELKRQQGKQKGKKKKQSSSSSKKTTKTKVQEKKKESTPTTKTTTTPPPTKKPRLSSEDEEDEEEAEFDEEPVTTTTTTTTTTAATKKKENDGDDSDDFDYGDDDSKSSDDDSQSSHNQDDDDDDSITKSTKKPWMKKKSNKNVNNKMADDSDSDVDAEEEESRRVNAKEREQVMKDANLEDYRNVTIPRRRLERWCNEPYFDQAVVKFYVRLALGQDQKTLKTYYRLCEIMAVKVNPREYQFPCAPGNKPTKTNKRLVLRFGKSEKLFKMDMISDSPPTQEDLTQFLSHLRNIRQRVLTKKTSLKMRREQDQLVHNYVYTTEDIEKNIQQRKKYSKTISNIAAQKTRIEIQVRVCENAVKEAEQQLKVAEENKKSARSSGYPTSEKMDKITRDYDEAKDVLEQAKIELDERKAEQTRILEAEKNRLSKLQKNAGNVSKVNQKAKELNKRADVEAYKSTKAASTTKKVDLHARRKHKQKILWDVGQDKATNAKKSKDDGNNTTTPTTTTSTTSAKKKTNTSESSGGDKENKTPDTSMTTTTPMIIDQIHDLNIDEEILAKSSTHNIHGNGTKASTRRTRKGISFEEYRRRKEAGTL